jgi:hypothetical protein
MFPEEGKPQRSEREGSHNIFATVCVIGSENSKGTLTAFQKDLKIISKFSGCSGQDLKSSV